MKFKLKLIIFIIILILYEYFIHTQITTICEVKYIETPTKSKREQIFNDKVPTVFKNVFSPDHPMFKWTPEFFGKKFPEEKIRIQSSDTYDVSSMTFQEFITIFRNKPNLYCAEVTDFLSKINMESKFHKYMKCFEPPNCVWTSNALWLGAKGSRTNIHYDPDYRNVLILLTGKKKIHLFYPYKEEDIYPGVYYDFGACNSKVNFWGNKDKYPDFKDVRKISFEVEKGDCVFIPPYVWHAVENIEETLAISYRCEIVGSIISKIPGCYLVIRDFVGSFKKSRINTKTNSSNDTSSQQVLA